MGLPDFQISCLLSYLKTSNNGHKQSFAFFPFKADDQPTMHKILSKIDQEQKQKGFLQVPGRSDAGGNLEFISFIHTNMNNEFQVKIMNDNPHGMPGVAIDFHDSDNEEKLWVKPSGKLHYTEEELKSPNNKLRNLTFHELQRMKFADLFQPAFSYEIFWPKPASARVKINVVIEVIAYDHTGESKITTVTYPVQFTNFGEQFLMSTDNKNNRRVVTQLSVMFADAKAMLEEVESIIKCLSDGQHLTAENVQDLSNSKEKAGELLHHVIKHEDVAPFFLEALRSTGHPQNKELAELITK